MFHLKPPRHISTLPFASVRGMQQSAWNLRHSGLTSGIANATLMTTGARAIDTAVAQTSTAAVVGSRRALALHEQGMGERGP